MLVFDDVTPLIRAQKVAAWREVARRLAHEIKNPLTPIQLSAERLRRHFAGAPPSATRARRRVHDDDRRRGRVAEGAGRRVLAVRADAGAAHGADRPARSCSPTRSRSTTASSPTCAIEQRFAAGAAAGVGSTPSRSAASSSTSSTTPSRRWSGAARSSSRRSTTRPNNLVRVVVADDGPGIPRGRARQAVPAVLLDQAARQRPRPGDRPPHHRRARRQHRRRPTTRRAARALRSSCRVDGIEDVSRGTTE